MSNAKMTYILSSGISVYIGHNAIEIRRGILNQYGFRIRYERRLGHVMRYIAEGLSKDGVSLAEVRSKFRLKDDTYKEIASLFEKLRAKSFIRSASEAKKESLIIGSLFESGKGLAKKKVLVLTEDRSVADFVKQHSNFCQTDLLDGSSNIVRVNLTSTSDTIEILNMYRQLEYLKDYEVLGYISLCPDPRVIENLNRISIKFDKVLTIGIVDGDSFLLASFSPRETGCFECLKNRSIDDGLEKRLVFLRNQNFRSTPLLSLLVSLATLEFYLLSATGYGYFMGKTLSIYLPTFKVQTQNFLRMPNCPACGYSALAIPKELYFDAVALDLLKESARND